MVLYCLSIKPSLLEACRRNLHNLDTLYIKNEYQYQDKKCLAIRARGMSASCNLHNQLLLEVVCLGKEMQNSLGHCFYIVVGITYRLPDIMVYLSAQEGPMKIIRSPRRWSNPKAQEPRYRILWHRPGLEDSKTCTASHRLRRKDRILVQNKLM